MRVLRRSDVSAARGGGGWKGKGRRTERVLGKVVALEVGLEEGAHLRVARARLVEDEEVDLEAQRVDAERDDDKAQDPRDPVSDVGALGRASKVRERWNCRQGRTRAHEGHLEVAKLVP